MLSFEGKEIEIDNDGYLKDSYQWSEVLVEVIVEKEVIVFFFEYWEVVCFVCEFYFEFNIFLVIWMLVKVMVNKFGEEKGNSCYLYCLFLKGLVK